MMEEILVQCQNCQSKYSIHSDDLHQKVTFKCTECGYSWPIEHEKLQMMLTTSLSKDMQKSTKDIFESMKLQSAESENDNIKSSNSSENLKSFSLSKMFEKQNLEKSDESTSSSIQNLDQQQISTPEPQLAKINNDSKSFSSKTFSFIMFTSIIGNVLFWIFYFLNFYFNINPVKTLFGL
jgi:predicted Zn finger-like uncharacterized protein